MRVAYFDCFSGASGDMLLGSLLDAGLALADLEADLDRLGVGGYRLAAERVTRQGLTGTHFQVLPPRDPTSRRGEESEGDTSHSGSGGPSGHGVSPTRETRDRPARTLPAIESIIGNSDLPAQVQARSLAVFRRIARAEAAIHGTTIEEVHFHEIGAVDSLVDVVGFASALKRLGIERVYSSPLTLGGGIIQTEHGRLPAPAPATLALLAEAGAPTLPGPAQTELVTPTAGALLSEFAIFERPAMTLQTVGYGFGTKQFSWPNALRVWLGESLVESPTLSDWVVEQACNLDDASGEALGYVMERLLAAGALDVWFTPIQMKKNRPATQLTVLSRPVDADDLAALLLQETPTLGVRRQVLSRTKADREVRSVQTPWGSVRMKVKLLEGQAVAASPEYDDCARIAARAGIPLVEVMEAARYAARRPEGSAVQPLNSAGKTGGA